MQHDSLNKFRQFITEQMIAQGMSRSDLSRVLGLHRSRVTKILDHDDNLTFKTMYRVAQALGYKIEINLTKE